MPKLSDFQDIIRLSADTLEQNLIEMRDTAAALPELPGEAEYLQLGSYEIKSIAQLMLNIKVTDRAEAVEVMKSLLPLPLSYSPLVTPGYRPDEVIGQERFVTAFGYVFPAFFFTQFQPGESMNHFSQLLWFHAVKPGLRIVVVTHIASDPAKLFPNDEVGLPNGIHVLEPPVPPDQIRSGFVHWFRIDMEKWYENFVGTAEAEEEWASTIEESKYEH